MPKYNFMFGAKVISKDLENDEAAIAEAEKMPGILRVKNDKNLKRIFTDEEAIAKTKVASGK